MSVADASEIKNAAPEQRCNGASADGDASSRSLEEFFATISKEENRASSHAVSPKLAAAGGTLHEIGTSIQGPGEVDAVAAQSTRIAGALAPSASGNHAEGDFEVQLGDYFTKTKKKKVKKKVSLAEAPPHAVEEAVEILPAALDAAAHEHVSADHVHGEFSWDATPLAPMPRRFPTSAFPTAQVSPHPAAVAAVAQEDAYGVVQVPQPRAPSPRQDNRISSRRRLNNAQLQGIRRRAASALEGKSLALQRDLLQWSQQEIQTFLQESGRALPTTIAYLQKQRRPAKSNDQRPAKPAKYTWLLPPEYNLTQLDRETGHFLERHWLALAASKRKTPPTSSACRRSFGKVCCEGWEVQCQKQPGWLAAIDERSEVHLSMPHDGNWSQPDPPRGSQRDTKASMKSITMEMYRAQG